MAVAIAGAVVLVPLLVDVEEVERGDHGDAGGAHGDGPEEPEEDGAREVVGADAEGPEAEAAVERPRDVPDGGRRAASGTLTRSPAWV